MANKINILKKALARLSLAQKNLAEESQVLGDLKAQEEAEESELETLRAELKAKASGLLSLNEELEKVRSENAGLKAQRDACLIKITELEVFSTSASSALRETQQELETLKNRMRNISNKLSR